VDFRNVSEMDTGDSSLYIILATQEVEIWRMEILRPAWAKKVMRHSPPTLFSTEKAGHGGAHHPSYRGKLKEEDCSSG
jgi:hypothetical protein